MLACGMSQNLYYWSIYKRVFNFYENPLKKQIHAHLFYKELKDAFTLGGLKVSLSFLVFLTMSWL
jgi:hypothetical protein